MLEIGEITRRVNGHWVRHRWDAGQWVPAEPVPAPEPKPFRPMLANTYAGEITFPVYVQPKLDGARCIARANGLFSRDGNRIETQPQIEAALREVFEDEPDLVLDGELYRHGLPLADIAKAARYGGRPLEFHVFDLVSDEPFAARLERLRTLGLSDVVETVLCGSPEELDRHYRACLQDGL